MDGACHLILKITSPKKLFLTFDEYSAVVIPHPISHELNGLERGISSRLNFEQYRQRPFPCFQATNVELYFLQLLGSDTPAYARNVYDVKFCLDSYISEWISYLLPYCQVGFYASIEGILNVVCTLLLYFWNQND